MVEILLNLSSVTNDSKATFLPFLTVNEDSIDTLLSIISTVLAIVAAVWVGLEAFNKLRAYVRDHREKVYAAAIKQFSETKATTEQSVAEETDANSIIISKLSALQTVTKYCEESYEQVFYLCALEMDIVIRTRLRQALLQHSKKAHNFLEMINRLIWKIYLEMPKKAQKAASGIQLSNKEVDLVLKKPPETKLDASLLETFGDKKTSYDIQNISRLLSLASSLFGEAMCELHIGPFIGYASQILYHVDFYHRALRLTTLEECVLRDCVSNQFKATLMTYKNCYIVNDNFTEAKFRSCLFVSVRIFNTKLDNARFYRNTFNQVTFRECSMKGTSFVFNRYKGKYSVVQSLLYMTEFYHEHFENCIIYSTTLSGAKFTACTFQKLHLIQCTATIQFEKCIIDDFRFAGKSLKGTVFYKCKFKNGRIVESNLKELQFIDCTFINPITLRSNTETKNACVIEGDTLTSIDESSDFGSV